MYINIHLRLQPTRRPFSFIYSWLYSNNFNSSGYVASNDWMIPNNKLESMRLTAVMTLFKLQSRTLPGSTEVKKEVHKTGFPVHGSRFEHESFLIQSRRVSYYAETFSELLSSN
jgi:hypothetical protein